MTSKEKPYFKYIYGPVSSWRLGRSLGIDPISQKEKVCCFDCNYCQVGRRKPVRIERKVFVDTEDILAEIRQLPKVRIDYITFSGTGEPTLAANLESLIDRIRELRNEPIAVITNSALLGNKQVREQVGKADLVMAKLDAVTNEALLAVNNPDKDITPAKIITGIKKLRKSFNGILALQIMFVEDNLSQAKEIAVMAKAVRADIIYINTPLRPCDCKALSRGEIAEIRKIFLEEGLVVKTVYDSKRKKVLAIDTAQTRKKRRLQTMKKRRIFKGRR